MGPRFVARAGSEAAGRVVFDPQGGGEELRKLCAKAGLGLVVDEINMLNGGKFHNPLDRDAFIDWEANVTGGECHWIILSPLYASWSRAQYSGKPGPDPVRCKDHPWDPPDNFKPERTRAGH